ncbi:MAG: WG repeat-containing protein, partial [Pyrinomonadaceae bacterium]
PTPELDDNYYGRSFSEGLAAVKIKDMWGFIDKTGKLVIQPQYIEAWSFSEGLAAAEVPIDRTEQPPCEMRGDPPSRYWVSKKYGYIDKTGKMVIPPGYEYAGPFVDGLANVSSCRHVSFIDKSGKTRIDTQYEYGSPFSGGLAEVQIGDERGLRRGYIDQTGKVVWEPSN